MVDKPSGDIVGADVALDNELDEIERRRRASGVAGNGAAVLGESWLQRAERLGLTALCLSGGGIRSAAFCLGVLQSLARRRLLNDFDYLSSVSGGGFIGGWLQVLIKESGRIDVAEAELERNNAAPLKRLRGFISYLTPHRGTMSADTWAAIVLYLRNLLLNWMVFAPAFLLLALSAVFYRTLLASLREHPGAILFLLILGTGSLVWSSWQACSLIPSHRTLPPGYVASQAISRRIKWPALVWAFLAPVVVNAGIVRWRIDWILPACYGLALLAGYGLAWMMGADRSGQGARLYRQNASRWLYATACSTVLTAMAVNLVEPGGLLYAVAAFRPVVQGPHLLIDRETALGTFGPLWFIGTHILHTTFYVAFRKEALHADLDREWLGRLSGVLLLLGGGWTVFALVCLIMPVLLVFVPFSNVSQWPLHIAAGGAVSTVAGAVAAWIGKQAVSGFETYAAKNSRWTRWLPSVLSIVFAAGVLSCSSSLVQEGLGNLALRWQPKPSAWLLALGTQLGLAVVLLLLAYWFGRVNVNRYSMHALFRNRLARAFLGSARQRRQPDPFTGFDPDDNPRLTDFAQATAGQRLFPVINMTLNVTTSSNTVLAERKAEPFIATPLFCGSAALRHPSQTNNHEAPAGAFVATNAYAGMESLGNENGRNLGPHLGSLLTISGAAISPSWGYHSSRVTAFLMTLFNVRLGVWLPNPAKATSEQLQLAKPSSSQIALFNEMLGATTDTSQAIYLSDGGHFENLGVYEMLRRRCQSIIVIDAGQDSESAFADLGNVIRKARIDFDTEIMMQPMRIYSRKDLTTDKALGSTALGVACGKSSIPGCKKGGCSILTPTMDKPRPV